MKTYCTPSVPELFYDAQRVYGGLTDTIELLRQRLASIVQNPGTHVDENDLALFMTETYAQFEEIECQWKQEHAKAWTARSKIIEAILRSTI